MISWLYEHPRPFALLPAALAAIGPAVALAWCLLWRPTRRVNVLRRQMYADPGFLLGTLKGYLEGLAGKGVSADDYCASRFGRPTHKGVS